MEFTVEKVEQHFDDIALQYDTWKAKNAYYYSYLKSFYGRHIPKGSRVVEFGCATGDILDSVKPGYGLGVDNSAQMIDLARKKHPHLKFLKADVSALSASEKFDAVIMADILDHSCDIISTVKSANRALNPGGRMLINTLNPVWGPLIMLAEKFKMKMPEGPHNFIPNRDIVPLLELEGFKVDRSFGGLLCPKKIPIVSAFFNEFLAKMPLFADLCFVQCIVATKEREEDEERNRYTYSLLVPTLNGESTIAAFLTRVSKACPRVDLLIIDRGSTDRTVEIVEGLLKKIRSLKLIKCYKDASKEYALRKGLEQVHSEVIVLMDSSGMLTPEEIIYFMEPFERKNARVVNGTRYVYPIEGPREPMLDRLNNSLFSWFISLVLGQRVTDAGCDVKAFFKKDLLKIISKSYLWQNGQLLLRTGEQKLKISEIPVHY